MTGSKSWLFVLMERGEIDLETIIRDLKTQKKLTPSKIRFYWEQMLEALDEVHQNGVIHADIKPANFILVKGNLKLIDFGLACKLEPGQDTIQRDFVGGTKDFLSPEVYLTHDLNNEKDSSLSRGSKKAGITVSHKIDIWALGIILYQWVYDQKHPYEGMMGGKSTRIKALTSLDYPVSLEPLGDPLMFDVIKLCLEKRLENRPCAKTLLSHPFLNPLSV